MLQRYWILILIWVIYFVVHSLAASLRVKDYFHRSGVSRTAYRKIYVVISTIGLFALLFYSSNLPESYLIVPGSVQRYISLAFAASGTIIIRVAFKQYNIREFLGFSSENPSGMLAKGGILAHVRHPIYSGTILIILGYLLYIPKLSSVIISLAVFIYLFIGILLEEKKLEKEFGEKYLDYKKRVPALVPRFKNLF